MIKLSDILPLIKFNDISIIDKVKGEEMCLMRNGFQDILSDQYLNAEVTNIDVDECKSDTIDVYIENEK